MTVTDIAQYISDGLALALVIRLLLLRLHSVYRVFCVFLLFDLFSSAVFFFTTRLNLDYGLAWRVMRPIAWVLSLWMVYALLHAMLANFPGILRLSRKILNFAFIAALIIALLTARAEYYASALSASAISANRALSLVFVLERVISMAAVLVLLGMLAFILWFPVRMPRNLAVFSIGFVAFFTARVALLLAHTYWPNANREALSNATSLALAGCCAYWLLLINRAGEITSVRIGHSWGPVEQRRLIGQLEAMNDALLRAARR
jgi:hypothetical protein